MNPDETQLLKSLLIRYCQEELDQWENIKIETDSYGDVFVFISRQNTLGLHIEDHDPTWSLDPADSTVGLVDRVTVAQTTADVLNLQNAAEALESVFLPLVEKAGFGFVRLRKDPTDAGEG